MEMINERVVDLARQSAKAKKPQSEEARRFLNLLKTQKLSAAFANGLNLKELCTFLEKTKADQPEG